MRRTNECATIGSMLQMVIDEIYDLENSMQEAADNMPEQLNKAHADAAAQLGWAHNELYGCDPPTELRDEEVEWYEWNGKIFRPQRRDNVVGFLRAYRQRALFSKEDPALIAKLSEIIEVLSSVYFPGMSGRRAA